SLFFTPMETRFHPDVFVTTLLAAALFSASVAIAQNVPAATVAENRFEKTIQTFEAADRASPPPKGAILLVGDSQFYPWKTLADDLPGYRVINRGVDSFQFAD